MFGASSVCLILNVTQTINLFSLTESDLPLHGM